VNGKLYYFAAGQVLQATSHAMPQHCRVGTVKWMALVVHVTCFASVFL